jgi:hypothetical protein
VWRQGGARGEVVAGRCGIAQAARRAYWVGRYWVRWEEEEGLLKLAVWRLLGVGGACWRAFRVLIVMLRQRQQQRMQWGWKHQARLLLSSQMLHSHSLPANKHPLTGPACLRGCSGVLLGVAGRQQMIHRVLHSTLLVLPPS